MPLRRRAAVALLGVLALVAGAIGGVVAVPRAFRAGGGEQEVSETAGRARHTSRSAQPAGERRTHRAEVACGGGDDLAEVTPGVELAPPRSIAVGDVVCPPGLIDTRATRRASARAPPSAA